MRAWLMDSYDGVDKLRQGEVADPEAGPGQVVLRVRFAALNPADAFLARAMYPAKPALPHILGRDAVGDVVSVGLGVEQVRVGETVGILRCDVGVSVWGTLAEKVVVPADCLGPIPAGWRNRGHSAVRRWRERVGNAGREGGGAGRLSGTDPGGLGDGGNGDRKSTRLNSSHL